MKTLFKTAIFATIGAVFLASCNKKDDFDYDDYYLKQEQAIDSIFQKDEKIIQNYIDESFQEDSLKISYNYLNKTIKRGIWYKVIQEPTEEDNEAYTYKVNSTSYNFPIEAPKVNLKYTARLLDGTTLEDGTLVENEPGGEYNFKEFENYINNFSSSNKVINWAWVYAFAPYSIRVNESNTVKIGGLTKNGLKKGSKIVIVTSSYWAYGTRTSEKIPANSPLVYEFEVLGIN